MPSQPDAQPHQQLKEGDCSVGVGDAQLVDKSLMGRQGINAGIRIGDASGIFGCIDEIDEAGIKGWIIDAADPGASICVIVLIGDREIARTFTHVFRKDISGIVGRPVYAGFLVKWSQADGAALSELRSGQCAIELRELASGRPLLSELGKNMDVPTLRNWVSASVAATATSVVGVTGDQFKVLRHARADAVKSAAALSSAENGDVKRPKVIAFYLPQFHPIPENDQWWGRGFTEWTNVVSGKPLFDGHYQPHEPADLGYYDLRSTEVRRDQIRLAQEYGIYGFCYYYYWFGGRRILERPLNDMVADKDSDFPFCICWANESWSRRWDGSEHQLLLKQEHTLENDIAFIEDVIPLLKDPRYIRVDGSPVLMIYRVSLFPDPVRTTTVWRNICAKAGIPSIHLVAVEAFGFTDPQRFGFDASAQFPPHGIPVPEIQGEMADELDPGFKGRIYSYEDVVAHEVNAEQPVYPRYRGVMLSWDNTARRKLNAHIYKDASPELYEVWLRAAVDTTLNSRQIKDGLIFVNAWNEWAEGTHLEPDRKYGSAYLEATRRVVQGEVNLATVISLLEKSEELGPDRLRSILADLRSISLSLETSSRFIREIRNRNSALFEKAAKASSVCPRLISEPRRTVVGVAQLDRVNAYPGGTIGEFDASVANYIEGWAVIPGFSPQAASVSYLRLVHSGIGPVRTKDPAVRSGVFYMPIRGRHERRDVSDTLTDRPVAETMYSGFRAYADLSQVPPGAYRMELLVPMQGCLGCAEFGGEFRVV